jgi:eukaryotic-like serine/threonine-protein kinase
MQGSNFELSPHDWSTLRGLLDTALDLAAAEREHWVEQLDAQYAAFKPRLRSLLAHADSSVAEALLNTLPKVETDQFAPQPQGAARDGIGGQTAVGPYRLLRQLGEGGMAAVWLAERTDVLQSRKVALKLPHGAWRRAGLAERMAREREILATLEHPNIARLYDAGVADDGQPYLALEYVEGQRIDRYCREKALDVRQSLGLFLQVTKAVAYAHANLVVHRDLKPSNILVTADGQVRLLDFGIAKLLEQGVAHETELTREVGRALTPDYAAPEQIQGRAIGTAADIYSLGVVLFELLTGERPYKLKRGSRSELEEAILQAEPLRPSDAVAGRKTQRELRGDVDTIVLKALKKSPSERFATVDALADDITRHLSDEPVLARPDSRWYRASRFVRRHRWGVGAVATIMLAVLTGAAVSVWQAKVAREAQARAEEIRGFLTEILQGADIYRGGGERVAAADLLEQARQKIDRTLVGRPDLKLEMQTLIGLGINNLHEPKAAESLMRQAVAEGTAALGATDDLVLRARETHALTLRYAGQREALRKELETLIPALRAHEGTHAAELVRALESQNFLANSDGRHADAERAAREMLAIASRRLGMQHPLTVDAQWALIDALQLQGKLDEALPLARLAYPATLARHGGNTRAPSVIEAGEKYGRVLARSGDLPGGLKVLVQVVDDASAVFGPDSIAVGFFASNLARWQSEAGQIKAGLASIERSLRALAKAPGAESPAYATSRDRRATLLLAARRAREAADEWLLSSNHWARLRGPTSEAAMTARLDRVRALAEGGDEHTAWRELRALPQGTATPLDRWTLARWLVQGRLQREAGDARAALLLHDQALDAWAQNKNDSAQRIDLLHEKGLDYLALRDPDGAIVVLEQASSLAAALWTTTTPAQAEIWLTLGRAHLDGGRATVARNHLERADAFWADFDAENRRAGETAFWLGRCQTALGTPADAQRSLARAERILSTSPVPSDAALWASIRHR